MKVVYTDAALHDIDEATTFIRRESPRAAARVAGRIRNQVRDLRRWPMMGRYGAVPGTRELVISGTSYKAIYIVHPDHVEITRLMHTSRQWPPGA